MTPGSVGCDKLSAVWFVIDSHFVKFCQRFIYTSGSQPGDRGSQGKGSRDDHKKNLFFLAEVVFS